jgi:hypothetical protein
VADNQKMGLRDLTAQRNALLAARYRGVRTVEIDGRRVTYAADNEMAAAITDLERRIPLASSDGRRCRILTTVAHKSARSPCDVMSSPSRSCSSATRRPRTAFTM